MSIEEIAYSLDPVTWVHVHGSLPGGRTEAGRLDSWQAEVLRSRSKRILLCCSRQSGKSTVTSALALWTAIYHPGSLILCLSPTFRQSFGAVLQRNPVLRPALLAL